jgi:Eukaryotic aspartyl protease
VALASCTDCGVTPEYVASDGSCSGSTTSNFGAGSLSGGGWTAQICSADVEVGGELPPVNMRVAGITTQSQFFEDYHCPGTGNEGILGMGPLDLDTIGTASDDAYFPALVQQGVPDVVGILLCSDKGELWLGGYDPDFASGPPRFTPMANFDAWAVDLQDIGLGDLDLGGSDAQSIVDTGTWGFYMPGAAFTALGNSLAGNAAAAQIFGAATLGTGFFSGNYFTGTGCAAPVGGQTQAQIDDALPPMTLTLPDAAGGSFTLTLPATRSYLAPVPVNGTVEYCSGIADNALTGNVTLLGGTVLQAYLTLLDEGNHQVGFAPQSFCP